MDLAKAISAAHASANTDLRFLAEHVEWLIFDLERGATPQQVYNNLRALVDCDKATVLLTRPLTASNVFGYPVSVGTSATFEVASPRHAIIGAGRDLT